MVNSLGGRELAEITRKKETKISEEERLKKEEKLRKLQEKLAKLEQEEQKSKVIEKKSQESQISEQRSQLEQKKTIATQEKSNIELEAEQLLKNAGVSLDEEEIDTEELDQQVAFFEDLFEKKLKVNVEIPESDELDPDKVFGKAEVSQEKIEEKVFQDLIKKHDWLVLEKFGFMYTLPDRKNKSDYDSWLNDWMHVFLDYAIISKSHYLYPRNLSTTKPFDKFTGRLTEILEICEGLVKKGSAEWIDKKKKDKLRVHWKTLANWADDIVNWARDNAFSEPIFIQDIRDSMEDFANLPEEDLMQIFKMIEKNKDGKIIKVQNTLALKFKL